MGDRWMKKLVARVKRECLHLPGKAELSHMLHIEAPPRRGLCLSVGQCMTRPCFGKAVPGPKILERIFQFLVVPLESEASVSWLPHLFTM